MVGRLVGVGIGVIYDPWAKHSKKDRRGNSKQRPFGLELPANYPPTPKCGRAVELEFDEGEATAERKRG